MQLPVLSLLTVLAGPSLKLSGTNLNLAVLLHFVSQNIYL